MRCPVIGDIELGEVFSNGTHLDHLCELANNSRRLIM